MTAAATTSSIGAKKLVVLYHGDTCLGEAETTTVIHPNKPQTSAKSSPFPRRKELRISHLSLHSERCPPLAILQIVSPFHVKCKLQALPSALVAASESPFHRLYLTCFQEFKTAVLLPEGEDNEGGNIEEDEEVHVVAMPSKVEKVPCFWCIGVSRKGLYEASSCMLNPRCLAIVFDLDETLIVANTLRSFEDRIEALSRRIDAENDPQRISGMSQELKRYLEDRDLLRQFIDSDSVSLENGRTILPVQTEEVVIPNPSTSSAAAPERVLRPIIRIAEKNVVLTRINPEIRDTSVFVRLRPAWEDLRSYLTAKGRKRFEVYVCTMAERDYALEMWRLLDPEANLISKNQLSERIVCVKSGSKKSLQHVLQDKFCHPSMAMVIDDRLHVWEDRDQPRVHVVPAYTPYYAPHAEMAYAVPVLCVARNVACNVRGGFFKEFDENVMRKIFELNYENDVLELPHPPDVGDYLFLEDTNAAPNNKDVPVAEGINGAEGEVKMNGSVYPAEDLQLQNQTTINSSDDEISAFNRGSDGNGSLKSRAESFKPPSHLFVPALLEIARRCDSKVEFKATLSSGKSSHFSVEVVFDAEKIGYGTGNTREEAQLQAAENALRSLANNYLSFIAPLAGMPSKVLDRTSVRSENGFLEELPCSVPEDLSRKESEQLDQSSNPGTFFSTLQHIRELCLDAQNIGFQDYVSTLPSTGKEQYCFQVELGGQVIGKGTGLTRNAAKHQAIVEALRTVRTTVDPQIKKYLK